MSSPHKPRKKKRTTESLSSSSAHQSSPVSLTPVSKSHLQSPEFPLCAFLWLARKSTSQWVLLPLILMAVGLFRWALGLWGHSGLEVPPLHGDFEAQRHWMELTTNLPMSRWYFYDLNYWGLDYPPLTAYHSWVIGKIGSLINPSWFALDASRGFESPDLKIFMRATVLISEYLAYVPAVVIFNRRQGRHRGVNAWEGSIALVAILLQPATMLIDHGHFQYNTVMLGFVVASLAAMFSGHVLWGSMFFVAALSFKQMALYYAPVVFAYLLGFCLFPRPQPLRLFAIAFSTVIAFAIVFGPLILGTIYDYVRDPLLTTELPAPPLLEYLPLRFDRNSLVSLLLVQLTQVIHRTFPFSRGLFEDKVANIWCTIHTVHKLNTYPVPLLTRVSLASTVIAILPASLLIFLFPHKHLLPFALASCAWGFFLCSFQVHEKSALLPLLPMTISLGSEGGLGSEMRAWIGWANMLGTWTLFPLLKRDELRIPYFVLTLLWAYLLGLPPMSRGLYRPKRGGLSAPTKLLHLAFYSAMIIWHGLEALVPPPAGKPDLWVVINCVLGTAGFGICWLWCTGQLLVRTGVLEDYFGVRVRLESESEGKGKVNGRTQTKKVQ